MSNVFVNFIFGGNSAQLQTAAQQAQSALARTGDSFVVQRLKFIGATAAITGFSAALIGTVKSLIETSAEFQRLGTSFVSILAGPLLDAKQGAALTAENLKSLKAESVGLFEAAQRAAVDTVATTKEYVSTLQAALAIGQNIGLNQKQIEEIVHRLVVAAGQFGIEQEKVGTSIAQIFAGSVRVTNQLARNLGLGSTEARKQLKDAIALGTVYDFLVGKTKGFAATSKESADNFSNVFASIKDIFQIGGTAAIFPLFDAIRKQLLDIRDEFFGLGADSPALKGLVAGFREFFAEITPSLQLLASAFGDLFSSIGSRGSGIASVFSTLVEVIASLVKLLAQAISLQGLGGFVALTYGAVKAGQLLVGIWKTITDYQKLSAAAQAGQGLASATSRALAEATGRSAGAIRGNVADVTGQPSLVAAAAQARLNLDLANEAVRKTAAAVVTANAGVTTAQAGVAKLAQAVAQTGIALPAAFSAGPIAKVAAAEVIATEATVAHTAAVKGAIIVKGQHVGIQNILVATEARLAGAEVVLATVTAEEAAAMEVAAAAKAKAAAAAAALTAAQRGLWASYGPLAIILVVITAAYFLLGENAEEAAKKTDKLREASQRFKEEQETFAKNRNLEELIADYDRLSKLTDRTYADSVRLAEVTNLLAKAYGSASFSVQDLNKNFAGIQSALSQDLKTQTAELKKLKEAADILRQGAPSQAALTQRGGASGPQLVELERANKAYADASKIVAELGSKHFPNLTEAVRNSDDGLKQLSEDSDIQSVSIDKQIKLLDNLTKSKEELLQQAYEASQQDQTNIENLKKLNEAEGALLFKYLLEQKALGKVGEAATAAARAAVQADIAKNKSALEVITKLEIQNDLLVKQGKLYIFNQEEALALGVTTPDEQRKRLESSKARLEEVLKNLSIKAPSAGTGKKAGKGRDELRDFISELQRQLGLLSKLGDSISKEANRIVDFRTKIIKGLGEAGVIPFQTALDIEEELILKQFDLDKKLSDATQKYIKDNAELAKLVAQDQDKKDRGKDKTGTDQRKRDIETQEKIVAESFKDLSKLQASQREKEDRLFDIGQRQSAERIRNIKAEADLLDEVATTSNETAAKLAALGGKIGLKSPEEVAQAQFEADTANREIRIKARLRAIYPETDEKLQNQVLVARTKLKELIGKDADELAFARLDAAISLVNVLRARLTDLNVKTQQAIQNKNPQAAKEFEVQSAAVALALAEAEGSVAGLTTQLGLSSEKAKELGSVFGLLTGTTEQLTTINKDLADIKKERAEQALDTYERLVQRREITLNTLELEGQFIDANLQQLSIKDQILKTQKELGVITESQFRNQTAALLDQRLAILGNRKLLLETQLTTVAGSKKPEDIQKQIGINSELDQLNLELFQLKNQVFDLRSPLIALRNAFSEIGDAVSSLPGPFNKLKGVFTGLEKLANALANIKRPEAPQLILQKSADGFQKAVTDFQKAVVDLINFIRSLSSGGAGASSAISGIAGAANTIVGALGDVESGAGGAFGAAKAAAAAAKTKTQEKIVAIIAAAGQTVAGLLGAIANKDIGQGIASFAPLAGLIPVAGPFIEAGLQIVGGIVSFFGARAKEKTHQIAETINVGVEELKHAMSTGAVGLGDGVRQLRAQLESARRQLSGRKGGAEELKKIEDSINSEIQALKDRAAEIQKDFKDQLKLLRAPADLRDLITKIKAIEDTAKAYLASFESIADAQAAAADVEEFVRRSIDELRTTVKAADTKVQDDFRAALEELRTPSGLRSTVSAINAIADQARAFLESFPTAAEATAALGEAQEFIRLSLEQLEGEIRKALEDLQQNLTDITNQFIKDQHDILLEGRIDPQVSEAESKRRKLVELAERFAKEKKGIEAQITAEKQKLEYAQTREKLEQEIAKFTERAADKMGEAADKLLDVAKILENIFKAISGFNFTTPASGGGGGSDGSSGGDSKDGIITLNFKLNGEDIGSANVGIGSTQQLEMAGLLSSSRLSRFNPQI